MFLRTRYIKGRAYHSLLEPYRLPGGKQRAATMFSWVGDIPPAEAIDVRIARAAADLQWYEQRLDKARQQRPEDRPASIYDRIRADWVDNLEAAEKCLGSARKKLEHFQLIQVQLLEAEQRRTAKAVTAEPDPPV